MTNKKPSGGSGSGGMGHLLKMSPMARVLSGAPPTLPSCDAPSLVDLAVTVPAPAPITGDDLLIRLHQKVRALAPKRDRAEGETLSMGDQVLVDTVGYAAGKLLPFSARFDAWLDLEPMLALPGFSESIAQGTVGGSQQINLTLPADFPVPAWRGMPARFIVDIKGAREVRMPNLESPAALKLLEVASIEAAMELVRGELEDERRDELVLEAQNLVLDELARRAHAQVPKALVDEEIRRRWGDSEGKALVDHNFDVEEQQEALQAWLNDPPTRADCERRLRVGLALKAMTDAEGLTLTPEKLEALVREQVEAFGLSADEVAHGLRESKEITKKVTELGWYLLAVDHALSKAKITFLDA